MVPHPWQHRSPRGPSSSGLRQTALYQLRRRKFAVNKLTLQALDTMADPFNQLVAVQDEQDTFCSSTHWIIPAHRAFASFRPLWIRESDAGYVVLARSYHPSYGLYLEPLEAIWGLACPFIPRQPEALARDFAHDLFADRRDRSTLVLGGLKAGGAMFDALRRTLMPRMRVAEGPTTRRFRASLEGGIDGFLSRRSPKFRASLRRSERMAREAGVTFERIDRFSSWHSMLSLYERILAIERRSWKGLTGSGLVEPAMQEFYRLMLARIWPERAVRVIIARQGDEEVGFLFGALFHGSFRGLQVSFDHRFARLSLGNLLQWNVLQQLCGEGCLLYDLGVEVPYKERWAEQVAETVQLIAL
jgi:hypothetical protein